jgi:hypothetical protein
MLDFEIATVDLDEKAAKSAFSRDNFETNRVLKLAQSL